jgi:hypothetical protein
VKSIRALVVVFALMTGPAVRNAHAIVSSWQDGVVSGRVVQTLPNGRVVGVPGLQVKLIPPTASQRPPLISLTNSLGNYGFERQPKGPYLFEISRGPVLVYRRLIDTTRDSSVTISLKRRP